MSHIDFLRACFDEEEHDAQAAIDDGPHWLHEGGGKFIQGDAGFATSSGWLLLPHRHEAADHIARQDPAQTLRRIAALRKIVDQQERGLRGLYRRYSDEHRQTWEEWLATWPTPTLDVLCSMYADHPDYPKDRP